ncbi:GNAT family N-acetyltransferase [Bacillus litorisediminis]|uniref:GNAT family N-acetyltransferase n=1 Tax=Bacillus litorisediminis TaxID=2922713 RepID=UPI001FAFBD9A|nr:N-acetyltransferase [Bacillus litorisediminis]
MYSVRPEKNEDYAVIKEINDLAFNGEGEGKLIELIRGSDHFIPELSLVAEDIEGKVVGHILFSLVHIQTETGLIPTLALAPMAVLPAYQNQGIGSILVRSGLERAKELGYTHVVVLGHPHFYPKFGFIPSIKKGIESPFAVPAEVFMVTELAEGALDQIHGKVVYPPAFEAVS